MNPNRKPTPERIEYEKAAKHIRLLDLKTKLSEVGIDTSKVPRQKLDKILRTIETQNSIYRESQAKIQVIQQGTQKIINDIAKEGEAIVDSIKKEYGIYHSVTNEELQPVPGSGGLVQLSPEDEAILIEYAKKREVPKAEALRMLIEAANHPSTDLEAPPVTAKSPTQKEHEAGCGCSECAGAKPEDKPPEKKEGY